MMVASATGLSSSLRSLSLAPGAGPVVRRSGAAQVQWEEGWVGASVGARRLGAGGPQLGGSAGGVDFLRLGSAGGGKGIERSRELLGGEVAMQEMTDLGAGQPVGGADERGVDLLGERVAGCLVERPCG